MITYSGNKSVSGRIWVTLDGKAAGEIVEVLGGYQYRPRGSKKGTWGEIFKTPDLCKQSLEGL